MPSRPAILPATKQIEDFFDRVGLRTDSSNYSVAKRAIMAAVQRNPVYWKGSGTSDRRQFREDWAGLLIETGKAYRGGNRVQSDEDHCAQIEDIACWLWVWHANTRKGRKIRFATSQKALNLYLKCLWLSRNLRQPPHCPIDSIVLRTAKLNGAWTGSDSRSQYMRWMTAVRTKAKEAGKSVSLWEFDVWLGKRNAAGPRPRQRCGKARSKA